ncbi:bifunctional UDP-2,4-diacetamido-2,4,6-trideoxy-beta-L-altropyranose hydrolase/GNAT family N-acetyltransferase [Hymenobacter cheonanensis]|uniref:bifunctional UDP-2,4-diacetamido-2,4,6-trideoxy-beta-L-altropyranose hydrolase/GNAT family N-acetyltransferase n=1 Tax=Hymenobacter sp. CA2-7 TaxID=3063993 RepID=UPI002712729F|nr:bifunctional UDP-2,4-diacetamido-2,4,6-trideoxy-beta-L-altropyranose hydrolase/GNAT family N-acetyltransferase [Hymenobacter sp. CA2-7]MDO7886994.1 bifunctional UDP-2,4-diacetamido-2,4,6-trideoxy-beta-L-altropyranose hydrolase/GNAT family N-acetyltransferase [Hymenobacter sp. CA2-7]
MLVQTVPAATAAGLPEATWLAGQLASTDIVILDGYHFTPGYQQLLAATGAALVCLDDLTTPPAWATVVLNQAGGVGPPAYAQVPLARLCLGPAYALLRPEFWQHTATAPTAAPPRLFLNMGGADPTNQTALLLPRLRQQFPSYRLVVVTGAAYPYQLALQELAHGLGGSISLHHNLSAAELAAQLRNCQVFVCPPSGVAYECCATGGAVLVHLTAENQRALFNFLVQNELALPLATGIVLPEDSLAGLAAQQRLRQRQLFDGQAGQRLQAIFACLAVEQQYAIRRATLSDAALYFTWANDPAVRQNAIHPEPIAWEVHHAWFSRRLHDADSYLYLLHTPAGNPIGQVRIEFDSPERPGTIDYSLAPAYRGQGLGQVLLRRALQQLRLDRPLLAGGAVQGQVKATNQASLRVFEQLRFVRQAAVTLQEEVYAVFRLDFPLAS